MPRAPDPAARNDGRDIGPATRARTIARLRALGCTCEPALTGRRGNPTADHEVACAAMLAAARGPPPELPARRVDRWHLVVYCKWCDDTHRHGASSYGSRVAHCRTLRNPYRKSGYTLVPTTDD